MKQLRLPASFFSRTSNGGPEYLRAPATARGGPSVKSRQTLSDMRWEGEHWLSSEELADVTAKRHRKTRGKQHGGLEAASSGTAAVTTTTPVTTTTTRPPKPADPIDPNDVDPCGGKCMDKDRIPTRQMFVWLDSKWTLIDRPIRFSRGIFFSYAPIPRKQEDLLRIMLEDKTTPIDEKFLREELAPRLRRTHPVSLRLLDWLVVDYSLEKGLAYRRYVPTLKRSIIVVMHALYSSWLRKWRRRQLDPFRRRHRIYFRLDNKTYSTTVAQLHFFYMARLFGFLDYAAQHLEEILPHMKEVISETKDVKEQAKKDGVAYRRKPLVAKARPKAFIAEGRFTLYFGLEGTGELAPGEEIYPHDDEDEDEDDDDDGSDLESDVDDEVAAEEERRADALLSRDMKEGIDCLFGGI